MKRGVPAGLWMLCDGCVSSVYSKDVEDNLNVCPDCDHHFYVPAATRIAQLLDEDSFEEWHQGLAHSTHSNLPTRNPTPTD